MPDKRVETWASKQFVADIAGLTAKIDTEETDCLVVQITPFERELILSIVGFYLRWPTRWKMGGEGSIPGDVPVDTFNELIDNLEKHLMEPLGCGGDLNRIANVLEEWYDGQYISILELKPLIYALPFGEELWLASDILGELFEAVALIPDLGINIKMSWEQWWTIITTGNYRKNTLEKLNDLIATTHGVATGTMGPTLADVFEQYVDGLPGFSIVDFLMNNVDESIIRVAGLDLPTILAGNYMTNKTDDVRNALNGGIIPSVGYNVTQKIDQLTASIQALGLTLTGAIVGAVGGVDGCGCVTIGPDDGEDIEEPIDVGVGDPPGDFNNWSEYSVAKCQIVNKLADEVLTMIERAGGLGTATVGMTIAGVIALLASLFTGIGLFAVLAVSLAVGSVALTIYSALAGLLLAYPVNVLNLHGELLNTVEQFVCDMFLSESPEDGRAILTAWIDQAAAEVSSNSDWLARISGLSSALGTSDMLNGVYNADIPIDPEYVGAFDCVECVPVGGIPFDLVRGTGTIRYDGVGFNITSELSGGFYQITMTIPDVEPYNNWCVEFVSRTTMQNGAVNYTRQLLANGATYLQYLRNYDFNSGASGSWPGAGNRTACAHIQMTNDTSFTMNFRIHGPTDALSPTDNIDTFCDA